MRRGWSLIGGAALGAAVMYALDPDGGRRRRALLRDRMVHAAHRAGDAVDASVRDIGNRAVGLAAEGRSLLRRGGVDDMVLAERVRERLGTVLSHPSSVDVTVSEGLVTLRGPVLAREVNRMMRAVSRIRGVESVEHELDIHDHPGDEPGLQGSGMPRRGGGKFELFQRRWSPTARVLTGAAGSALVGTAVARPSVPTMAAGMAGLGLLARAVSNMEVKRLIGAGAGRRAVDIQKTINIAAPVEKVYAFWTDYENYPLFMAHVRRVHTSGPDRTHWEIAGPGGLTIQWDAITTQQVPSRVLAWKTVDGSAIQHSGIVHFLSNADGSTKVEVRMGYNPVAGVLGHLVASLLGVDPRTQLDEDLMRMKALIETGNLPGNAAIDQMRDGVGIAGRRNGGAGREASRRSVEEE